MDIVVGRRHATRDARHGRFVNIPIRIELQLGRWHRNDHRLEISFANLERTRSGALEEEKGAAGENEIPRSCALTTLLAKREINVESIAITDPWRKSAAFLFSFSFRFNLFTWILFLSARICSILIYFQLNPDAIRVLAHRLHRFRFEAFRGRI